MPMPWLGRCKTRWRECTEVNVRFSTKGMLSLEQQIGATDRDGPRRDVYSAVLSTGRLHRLACFAEQFECNLVAFISDRKFI